ncbi:MAG: WD40 repeat domain-containing protein [Thiohalomonadales bacterium]
MSIKIVLIIIFNTVLVLGCSNSGSSSNKDPVSIKPDKPVNVVATYQGNKALVSWELPITSDNSNAVKYYLVERSILNQNNFIKLSAQLPATQLNYTDPMVSRKYGDSFEYRVTAGNKKGVSTSGLSLPVTPGSSLNISHVASNYLTSSYAGDKSNFGFKLAFSADGKTAAVAIKSRTFVNGRKVGASVEIFKRGVVNDWSAFSVAVIHRPGIMTMFALSPDGKTLALSENSPSSGTNIAAGAVELFTQNSSGLWDLVQTTTLVSPAPGKFYQFGSTLVFSPDSKSLAVSEAGTSIVRVYNKVNGSWGMQPGSVLNNTANTAGLRPSIAFSPSGNILAIGDPGITVNSLLNAGAVQLFSKKTDGSWNTVASTSFNSKQPGKGFLFGQSIALSADGNTIAISEESSQVLLDNTATYQGGNVQLFTKDSLNKWKAVPDTIFVSSASLRTSFGMDFTFNRTGTMLAISEGRGVIYTNGKNNEKSGAVLVFKKDTSGVWLERPVAVLGSLAPSFIGEFGSSVVFNPGDDTLFVGEPTGFTKKGAILETGYINIYDSRLFK